MGVPLTLREFETVAAERMAPACYDYVAGGALDEVTVRANEEAFARRRFRPRVMIDVSSIDVSTMLLGQPVSMPVGIAPTAQHGFGCVDAEAASARAATAAGVVYCASTMSTLPLADIAAASGAGPRWFQLYIARDRSFTESLVRRAVAAGYTALVVTVDTPIGSRRERDLRAAEPTKQVFGNLDDVALAGNEVSSYVTTLLDPSVTWRDLDWLRSLCGLPIVLKGIVTAEDARLAVENGAAAVWVSNHGGRQLDRAIATLDALPEVVDAVAGRAEVYVDGGVRRGGDVAMALALGARAAFIGRPVIYALAYDGEAGVTLALDLLRAEMLQSMALLGAPDLASLTPGLIAD